MNIRFDCDWCLLLAPVVCWIPYLQLQFVESNSWRDLFQLRTVRGAYRRAPIAMTLALTLLLLFSVPLYLIKIELLPRETVWLPGLFFFVFIWPARIILGWAWGEPCVITIIATGSCDSAQELGAGCLY